MNSFENIFALTFSFSVVTHEKMIFLPSPFFFLRFIINAEFKHDVENVLLELFMWTILLLTITER